MIARYLNGPAVVRLRRLATGGVASIAVSVGVTSVLRIISSMTLTRVLDSHAYGVVGVITTVAFMLGMLSDVGLASFIIRHKDGDDPTFRHQIWTIRLIRGAMLSVVMAVLAKPAAIALGKPELAPVVAIWGISFFIEGLSSLAFATAIREQKLWRMSMLDLSLNVVTFVVSVALALVWRSYWALIVGMLAGAISKTLLSYILFPNSRQRFVYNRDRFRELWGFSRYIAMSSMLSLLVLQWDKVVLARMMPLATYGLYAIATTLAAAPTSLAVPYVYRVLYAAYTKTVRDDPEALRRVLYARRRKVVLCYMFAVATLVGGAPLLIEILYDPRYRGVAPYLQIITVAAVLRFPALAGEQALIALGRTRSSLSINVCRIVWLVIGGAIGIATNNIMLLVAVVGTVEVPGVVGTWVNLWRAKLLNVKEEAYGIAAAIAGVLVGFGVSDVGMKLLGAG
jgi:O-antigen/teichoic acid export membrane protein